MCPRYHARVGIYGFPSLISTSGAAEAPAKPREYYLKLRMGYDRGSLEQEFAGRFLEQDDPRLTDVMKGYLLQAVYFHLWGMPFCSDLNCRLYNAHFQEDVLHAQLGSPYELCPYHDDMREQFNTSMRDGFDCR